MQDKCLGFRSWYMIQCEYIIRCVFDVLWNRIFGIWWLLSVKVQCGVLIQACKTVQFLYTKNFPLISCVHKLINVNKNFNQNLDIKISWQLIRYEVSLIYILFCCTGLRFTKELLAVYKCIIHMLSYGLSCKIY